MDNFKFPMYISKTGAPVGDREHAFYCIDVKGDAGMYKLTRRSLRGRWKELGSGCLATVNRIYMEHIKQTATVPLPQKSELGVLADETTEDVVDKHTPDASESDTTTDRCIV